MEYLAHTQVTVVPQADGVDFAFPRPWLGLSMRQRVRQCRILLLPVAVAVALLAAAIYGVWLVVIPAAVFYVAFSCLYREDAVSGFITSFNLTFSGELARRDAARTQFLRVSGNMLIRTNQAGENRIWHQHDIADIRIETSPLNDGVLVSIVLTDRQGRRSILHDIVLSSFDYLPQREELASIADQLRNALDLPVRDLSDEMPAHDAQLLATAIQEETTHVQVDVRGCVQRPRDPSA